MRSAFFLIAAQLMITTASAGTAAFGPDILFKGVKASLTPQKKREIYQQLGLAVSGRHLIIKDFKECGAIEAEVAIEDLNHDGVPEVTVIYGNTCTSGSAGSSVSLFIRDQSAKYRQNLGFEAAGFEKLPILSKGFPDLAIASPGFCEAIWRWNGTSYVHRCNMPREKGACDAQGNVCRDR